MWHRLVKKLIETCIQSWEFCTAKFSAIEVEQVRLHHTAKGLQDVSGRVSLEESHLSMYRVELMRNIQELKLYYGNPLHSVVALTIRGAMSLLSS